jgi:DNA-binding NarL/FixJ family response regulator
VPTGPLSVLVVDDHPVMRDSLSMALGFEPGLVVWGTAESGDDALAQLGAAGPGGLPDAVLSDVRMPGMSGIELAAALLARWPALPCVMLSAQPAGHYAGQARAAGARGYVEKWRPGEAAEAVRRAVEGPGWVTDGDEGGRAASVDRWV